MTGKRLLGTGSSTVNIRSDSKKAQVDLVPQAWIGSGSKVNAMHPAYTSKRSLISQKTNVGAGKFDNSFLTTYGMVIVGFLLRDKLEITTYASLAKISQSFDVANPFPPDL